MVHDSFKVAAITESRQRDLQSVEAIEQVGAEATRSNVLVETGVRSGDEKDIDLGSDAANGAHGPVVKQAQKHGLERDGHVADLIKEQRAAVSLLDESNCTATPRAGERAVSIAEELGLNQAFGKGGAIDGDEGADPPAGSMGVAGQLFLAGTGLTADENRHLTCCRSLDLADDGSHRRIAGDEAGGGAPNVVLETLGPRRQIFPRARQTRGLAAFKCGFRLLDVAIGDG